VAQSLGDVKLTVCGVVSGDGDQRHERLQAAASTLSSADAVRLSHFTRGSWCCRRLKTLVLHCLWPFTVRRSAAVPSRIAFDTLAHYIWYSGWPACPVASTCTKCKVHPFGAGVPVFCYLMWQYIYHNGEKGWSSVSLVFSACDKQVKSALELQCILSACVWC